MRTLLGPKRFIAVAGNIGSGKSTLIKCIAGIHGYDSGDVFFDGEKGVQLEIKTEELELGVAEYFAAPAAPP